MPTYVGFLFHFYLLYEVLALPCTMRARLAQATVRALLLGDAATLAPLTVFDDLGIYGLPHPIHP